eukprot:SAG31_NODE_1882_length_7000_cov_3.469932_5_plen_132_part_00
MPHSSRLSCNSNIILQDRDRTRTANTPPQLRHTYSTAVPVSPWVRSHHDELSIAESLLSLPSRVLLCPTHTYDILALHLESVGHAIGTVCASAHPLTFRMQAQPIVSGAMVIKVFRSVKFSQTLKYPGVFK